VLSNKINSCAVGFKMLSKILGRLAIILKTVLLSFSQLVAKRNVYISFLICLFKVFQSFPPSSADTIPMFAPLCNWKSAVGCHRLQLSPDPSNK
jgi:hypothetical protein